MQRVKYLDVYLRQPDWMLHPMQRFIRDRDVVRYEELQSWNVAARDDGIEYELFYVEADRDPYVEALDAVESIRWYDVEPIDEDSFYVYVCQETRPEDEHWREAFAALNLVVVPPVIYDAEAAFYMTVVGGAEDLRAMLDGLPDDVEATVRAIGEYDRRHAPVVGDLTDRQLEAVEVAAELGFYEVPREADVADVAAELDCAESTAATLLQKAEGRSMKRIAQRYGREMEGA